MKKQGFQHAKALGQNFLSDEQILSDIVAVSGVTPEDAVFEVGAGMGDLSFFLAQSCRKLLSVEVDDRLLPFLKLKLNGLNNVDILHSDVQKLNLVQLLAPLPPLRVVANLPYYLTTPLLETFFHLEVPLLSVSVMVQKEAGQRVLAGPKEDGWGPLPILIRVKAEPRIALNVPSHCFTPPPKVDSVFLHMPFRQQPLVPVERQPAFFRLVRLAFAKKRKTLLNNLMPGYGLSRTEAEEMLAACGFSNTIRAEEMDIPDFALLLDKLPRE